ncbi:hypothetical protein [Lacinutrix sp. Hel_I_90]|uniref:hypothetical protein n=1 Tax=Lacinutrix sp. Hel_I_90 TaxID=1249999 RepID=UPI000695C359|nr:hypothetical protein [Lacinutrix sp. Hel_I_90]
MKKLILTALLLVFSFTVFSQTTKAQPDDKTPTATSQIKDVITINTLHARVTPIKTSTVKIKIAKKDRLKPPSAHILTQFYGLSRKSIHRV